VMFYKRKDAQRASGEWSLAFSVLFVDVLFSYSLFLLAFFQLNDFVCISHPFSFIRFGRTISSYIRCHLTYYLLVDAFDENFSLARRLYADSLRDGVFYRMGETQS